MADKVDALVIFGATGDLAKIETFPALVGLVKRGILAVLAAVWLVWDHRDGFAFTATAATTACCIIAIFADLYPNVMVSSTNPAYNLTVDNTASGGYSLKIMTVVVIILLPVVLAYQTWTYYVFRRRVSKSEFEPPVPPAAAGPQPTPQPAAPSAGPGSR